MRRRRAEASVHPGMLGQIAAFTVAATLVTLSPGADMALVARRAVAEGWRGRR